MSRKDDTAGQVVVSTATSNLRTVVVDGHSFEVDFDNVELIHELFEVNDRINEVTNDASLTDREKLGKLEEVAGAARAVTLKALGDTAYETLFGSSVPLLRALKLVSGLTLHAGEVYDQMFSEYKPAQV